MQVLNLFEDYKGNCLRLCLADLREAIQQPRDTGFFLYRAIESLMQSFRTDDHKKSKERAWQSLRAELSVSEDNIRRLEQAAKSPRHGETRYISSTERGELFEIAWDIANRYIQYASSGYQK